jgi:hypothetical protein
MFFSKIIPTSSKPSATAAANAATGIATDDLKTPQKGSSNLSMVVKSGWLSKRGQSTTWRKRFVVLTRESLMYFHNEKDKIPRDSISVRRTGGLNRGIKIVRVAGLETAIDVFVNSAASTIGQKISRDRISLMMESEQDLQSWISALQMVGGSPASGVLASRCSAALNNHHHVGARAQNPQGLVSAGSQRLMAVRCANPHGRRNVLNSINAASLTPLQVLVAVSSASNSTDTIINESESSRADHRCCRPTVNSLPNEFADDLLALSWLLSTGVAIDNSASVVNALSVSLQHNKYVMSLLLARHGANPAVALHQLVKQHPTKAASVTPSFMWTLTSAYQNRVLNFGKESFKIAPLYTPGYSYLSLLFLSQWLQTKE